MPENRYITPLLFVDAGDINDDRLDFDGLDVLDPTGQKLGDVEGFVVQRDTKRPYYVVVDSGGWFSSRSFLVPIGHARLDAGNSALRVDLDKSTIQRFPEFDKDRFPEMSEDDARLFNERTLNACCATELQGRTGADRYDYDKWSHYTQPDWWRPGWFGTAGAFGSSTRPASTTYTDYTVPPASVPDPARERVIARDRDLVNDDIDIESTRDDRVRREERIREERLVREEPRERAQPGDILGIEHEGETTSLGDTARDEIERRDDELDDAAKRRRDELKDKRR